jgi:hypothetical protein
MNRVLVVGIVLLILGIALIVSGIVLSFPPPCGPMVYFCSNPNEGVGLALGISGGFSLFAGVVVTLIGAVLSIKKPLGESATQLGKGVTQLVWGKDCRYCGRKVSRGMTKCSNCGAPIW